MRKRQSEWIKNLNHVVEKHRGLSSQYGISDCYKICDDAVIAVTGQPMFENIEYHSEMSAAKELLRHGFKSVKEAFEAIFEEIPVYHAQRGDIGIIFNDRSEACGGFFCSAGFVCRNDVRVIILPISKVSHAYKVAR